LTEEEKNKLYILKPGDKLIEYDDYLKNGYIRKIPLANARLLNVEKQKLKELAIENPSKFEKRMRGVKNGFGWYKRVDLYEGYLRDGQKHGLGYQSILPSGQIVYSSGLGPEPHFYNSHIQGRAKWSIFNYDEETMSFIHICPKTGIRMKECKYMFKNCKEMKWSGELDADGFCDGKGTLSLWIGDWHKFFEGEIKHGELWNGKCFGAQYHVDYENGIETGSENQITFAKLLDSFARASRHSSRADKCSSYTNVYIDVVGAIEGESEFKISGGPSDVKIRNDKTLMGNKINTDDKIYINHYDCVGGEYNYTYKYNMGTPQVKTVTGRFTIDGYCTSYNLKVQNGNTTVECK